MHAGGKLLRLTGAKRGGKKTLPGVEEAARLVAGWRPAWLKAARLVAGTDRHWRKNKTGPAEEKESPRSQLLEQLKGELLSWRSLVLLLSSRGEGKLTVARWLLRLRLLLLLLLLLEASVTEEKSLAEAREMMQPPCVTFWRLLEVDMTVRRRVVMVVVAEGQRQRGKKKKRLVAGKLGSNGWFSSDFVFYFFFLGSSTEILFIGDARGQHCLHWGKFSALDSTRGIQATGSKCVP